MTRFKMFVHNLINNYFSKSEPETPVGSIYNRVWLRNTAVKYGLTTTSNEDVISSTLSRLNVGDGHCCHDMLERGEKCPCDIVLRHGECLHDLFITNEEGRNINPVGIATTGKIRR